MQSSQATRSVLGPQNPEDLAVVPGTDWIITSAMSGGEFEQAESFFVNLASGEVRPAYPGNCRFQLDAARYGDVEPPEAIKFHGLDVRQEADGTIALYQVNHPLDLGPRAGAGRESVEVFEIEIEDGTPSLCWVGGVPAPSWVFGNEVVALPDGEGFAITNTVFGGGESIPALAAGHSTGNVLEWRHRAEGWVVVEGTDVNGPNGLAVSPDGRWYFVASWGTKELHRISRQDPHGQRATIATGGLNDNVTWTPDGALLVACQLAEPDEALVLLEASNRLEDPDRFALPFHALRVDPETLASEVVLRADPGDRTATTVLQVGDEIWVGCAPASGLLAYQLSAGV